MAKVRLLDPTDAKRRLDRYELIGELASGGMATVFLARIGGVGGFQRFVAIKRLHPHLANEQEFIEMFLDEARLAAGIHDPHVVPILEVGESDSGYYLVMEYIEGDTLARIVARALSMAKPVPRPILLRVIIDALAGLHAAHELVDTQGQPVELVHRDVSPQNILVGVDGCSRLTDFGVAHAASRLTNTRTDRLKGKLAYMSPEQASAGDVDRRSDLFAVGIILWEVLTGRRLFKGETEMVTLQKITSEPIPRLSAALPGVHPALDGVCAKALDRDPNRRFRSATDMADAIERAGREAATASPSDLGVASPREVAAYIQSALGEDIAAQRESVRAWLSHSEPTLPKTTPVKPPPAAYDVTFRMPLDRSPAAAAPAAAAPIGLPVAAPGGKPRLEVVPEPRPDRTGYELLDDHAEAEDGEDGETLLMDRSMSLAEALGLPPGPSPAATPDVLRHIPVSRVDATPSALISVPPPPPASRMPQIVALVVGLVLAVGGFVMWWAYAEPTPTPTGTTAPGAEAAGATASPAASVTATPTATASATANATATAMTTAAQKRSPLDSGAPGPRGGKPTPATAPQAPTPPESARPPDMANPYR